MSLSKYTREALQHKLDIAEDEVEREDQDAEDQESWRYTVESLIRALERDSLKWDEKNLNMTAVHELENYLTCIGDGENKESEDEWREIVTDLCRAGWCEKHDPNSYYSHKPRTMVVDGIKYIV